MELQYVIISILFFGYFLERILDYLNSRRWSTSLPQTLRTLYNEEEYRKAQLYEKENKKLGLVSDTLYVSLMALLIHCGTFGKLDHWAIANSCNPFQATLVFFGIVGVLSELINLPFSIYRTFVVEEHFGFNKTTISTFIKDRLKGYMIAILLLGGLLYLFSWLYAAAGSRFWIYTWIVVSAVMMIMTMAYTSLILPLFNKLRPLENGPLRDAIEQYCKKTGLSLSDVYVMDGSKRSSKANAFFSGLGPKKKIVLYDTLIEKHTTDELVAILAHEAGHYKLKHTTKSLVLSVIHTGLMLYLFAVFMESDEVAYALGGTQHTIELGLLAFGILYSPVSLLVGITLNWISRKHEFEADKFAAQTFDGKSLQNALKKLSVSNLSNLNPHPAYVFFYYSHPPLIKRLAELDKVR
jgi:STE24 endopeptidase